MNAQNTSSNHTATEYSQSTYGASSSTRESEGRIDKAYLTSIRAILKFACLVSMHFCTISDKRRPSLYKDLKRFSLNS